MRLGIAHALVLALNPQQNSDRFCSVVEVRTWADSLLVSNLCDRELIGQFACCQPLKTLFRVMVRSFGLRFYPI